MLGIALATRGFISKIIYRYSLPIHLNIVDKSKLDLSIENKKFFNIDITDILDKNINLKLTQENINIKSNSHTINIQEN